MKITEEIYQKIEFVNFVYMYLHCHFINIT